MSSLYEVSNLFTLIMSKPNILSKILGTLIRGTQIEVTSFSGNWACFIYNNTTAYVKTNSLKVINNTPAIKTGSVIIRYLDSKTNNDVYTPQTINNLPIGTYSYEAQNIYGYKLTTTSPQSITLTESSPNVTITFYYTKILCSLTIRYIDENTENDISNSQVINNLSLGSYTYSYIELSGYKLNDAKTKTITFTENNTDITISFKYKEILGSVVINYIDSSSSIALLEPETISNLKLGSYTYDSKSISGYNITGSSSQTVNLSEDNLDADIIFEYEKNEVEFTSDLNINEVPYISTYYIKPIVKPGEEVFIDYYITDYYYKEYMEKYNLKEDNWGDDTWTEEVWNNETFTVTVRIEGQKDKVYPNLKAGDHRVSLGSFSTEGEQKFSILCTDKYGRNSHELFNFFLVQGDVEVKEYVMTEEDLVTYNIKNIDDYEVKKIIDLSSLTTKNSTTVKSSLIEAATRIIPQPNTYVCVIADTDGDGNPNNWWGENQVVYASDYNKNKVLEESTNTRKGLQQLLDDKKAAGYNKLTLLPGTYRIDHQKQIYIPTKFTLDMNGATLKQNQFTGASSLMIEINNTINSHVINGIIEGDYFSHDYANSTNNSEWVNGVSIGGEAKYSSFENLNIKNITGYGASNGIANSRDGSLGYTYIYPKELGNIFKLGDIDRKTGSLINSTTRTSTDFIDISSYSDVGYISIGAYLGYQGNGCGTWNVIFHFYDSNKLYIKSTDGFIYRRIRVPSNAKYTKITILNIIYPTSLCLYYFRVPTHCSFKNIKLENCRCVGLAQSAMNDMLVKSCEFSRCGQTGATCAYDAEDGWDMMQDVTILNNYFHNNPNNDFLTCAGHNFIVDGQNNGKIYIWERTRSLVIKNSSNVNVTLQSGGKNSIIKHGIYRIYDNIFTGGNVSNNLSKNIICTTSLSGFVVNSTLCGIADKSLYSDCIINVSSEFLGYLYNSITLINCTFIPAKDFTGRYKISFNGGHSYSYYFENCMFNGKSSLSNNNAFYSAKFINCKFEDTSINPNVLANPADIIYFENCDIGYSENNLIYYCPFAYTNGTNTNLQFKNCNITNIDNNTKSLIYAYAKPNGVCSFEGCIFYLPSNLIIFDGISFYKEYIENYTIKFVGSPLKNTNILISDSYKTNTNIKVTIN